MEYKIAVEPGSYLFGDVETTDEADIEIIEGVLVTVDAKIRLSHDIRQAAKQIDDYCSRLLVTNELHYSMDEAIELLRSKTHSLVEQLIGKSFPVYVLRGSKATLIVTKEGNLYTQLPSLLQQASNVLTAVATMTMAPATEELKAARLSICTSCPFILPESRRCVACGCYLDIKSSYKDAKCPKDYWNDT